MEAYAAAGVPVLAGLPSQVPADDPLGPPSWIVWMLSGAPAGSGMSLADVVKPILSSEDSIASDGEASAAARALLDDLAAARDSGDVSAAFVAAFADVRVRNRGVASLFDPALDPVATTVDLPTAYLLQWVMVRGVLAAVIDADAVAASQPSGFVRPRQVAARQRESISAPCSEAWGTEDTTTVANNLIPKVLGGVKIPGISIPGYIEAIIDLSDDLSVKDLYGRVTTMIGKINVATAIASMLMQLSAITVGGPFFELERTKTTNPGKEVTNRIDLSIDPGKLPDGNDKVLCALSAIANAAGLTLNFPPAGPLTGVDVILSGGTNIPERALINEGSLKMTTDASGSVTFKVIGQPQSKTLSDASAEDYMEYGITIEAQMEPVSGNSIFSTFFDSLTAPTGGAIGYVAPALDILKTIHWDLGEHFGSLIDWRKPSYQITGSQGEESIDQVVCDVSGPFELQGSVMTMSFTPTGDGAKGGSLTVEGNTGGASFTGSGTYTFNVPAGFGEDGTMQVDLTQTVVIQGQQMSGTLSIPFTMTALKDGSC